MVAGLVLPDVIAAIVTHLSADADVAALCSQNVDPGAPYPRIASSFPESSDKRYRWVMPNYAVLIRRAGGPPMDMDTGLSYCRFDLRCYGPGETVQQRRRLADQLWRTVHPALCPPPGYPSGFHAARTVVQQIYPEGEAFPQMEPGTDWAFVLCSYVAMYMSQRLAA